METSFLFQTAVLPFSGTAYPAQHHLYVSDQDNLWLLAQLPMVSAGAEGQQREDRSTQTEGKIR